MTTLVLTSQAGLAAEENGKTSQNRTRHFTSAATPPTARQCSRAVTHFLNTLLTRLG